MLILLRSQERLHTKKLRLRKFIYLEFPPQILYAILCNISCSLQMRYGFLHKITTNFQYYFAKQMSVSG